MNYVILESKGQTSRPSQKPGAELRATAAESFAPGYSLKYNKFYIGLARNGQTQNFVQFRPKKEHIKLELKLKPSDEISHFLDSTELDIMPYDSKWGRNRIRLTRQDIENNREILGRLMKTAFDNY